MEAHQLWATKSSVGVCERPKNKAFIVSYLLCPCDGLTNCPGCMQGKRLTMDGYLLCACVWSSHDWVIMHATSTILINPRCNMIKTIIIIIIIKKWKKLDINRTVAQKLRTKPWIWWIVTPLFICFSNNYPAATKVGALRTNMSDRVSYFSDL